MYNKAIFLDKDGTLIPDIPYNVDVEKITFFEGVPESLKRLVDHGFKLFIISNQAGIAKGYFQEQELVKVGEKLDAMLAEHHISLSGFYYCPHHPEGNIRPYNIDCDCRKPSCGMISKAAKDHDIDLKNSWMIGDILNDVEAGNRAGVRTILIDNGNETEWLEGAYRTPDYKVSEFRDITDIILSKH